MSKKKPIITYDNIEKFSNEVVPIVENYYFWTPIFDKKILQYSGNELGNLVLKLILKNNYKSKDKVLHLLKQNINMRPLRIEANVLAFLSALFIKDKLKLNDKNLNYLPFQQFYGLYLIDKPPNIEEETEDELFYSLYTSFAIGTTLTKFVEIFSSNIKKNPNIIL